MTLRAPKLDPQTGQSLTFSDKTYIMGILNVTPDSFSDGNLFIDKSMAVEHALDMARDGADIIDVGGESTRPGAKDVSASEEIGRVVPVIKAISKKTKIPISVDTRKSAVAQEAIKAGAGMVNDISGLRHDPDMAPVVAKYGAGLIVMHMKGTPRDMQMKPSYKNLIQEIIISLRESLNIAKRSGVAEDKVIVDPGPICIGTSRKSFLGKVLNLADPADRLSGTIATCVIAITKGANILRVHDVKAVKEAALITDSILQMKAA